MSVLVLTTKNFEEEITESRVPVLVDFWANWCGPCKMMAPVVEEISKEVNGKAKVCKVNIDDYPGLATKYQVMSIPTFLIFENGKVKNMTVGVQDKNDIISKI